MKGSIFFFLFLSITSFGQEDNWNDIETTGFGDVNNYGVHEFMVFKDTFYACVAHKFAGTAEIHRSGSGDANDWTQVNYDDTTSSVKGIPSINAYNDSIMWIATGNPTQGTVVYRTLNGTDWMPISDPGFGESGRWSPTPNMVVYQGSADTIPYLYAAGNSHGGLLASEVWRIPYDKTDPSDWEIVVDFDVVDQDVTQVTYFYEWNDSLYFSTNGDYILYSTGDGTNFNPLVGAQSFFHPADLLIASFINLGSTVYATTNNPGVGGKLYSSVDMNIWFDLTGALPGYDAARDFELHNLDTANGFLWITSYTDTSVSNGCPVWRSTDTTCYYFVQSNTDGFGNSNIDGENSVTMGFNGRQYFGGPNYFEGGQIWRTDEFLSTERVEVLDQPIVYPNPAKQHSSLNISWPGHQILKVEMMTLMGQEIGMFDHSEINLSDFQLEAGYYLIFIFDSNENVAVKRLILQ